MQGADSGRGRLRQGPSLVLENAAAAGNDMSTLRCVRSACRLASCAGALAHQGLRGGQTIICRARCDPCQASRAPARPRARHLTSSTPTPIPSWSRPVFDGSLADAEVRQPQIMSPALQLFGAGREQRIYALPPYTRVVSLDFDDHPFARTRFEQPALCGARETYPMRSSPTIGVGACSCVRIRTIAGTPDGCPSEADDERR